MRRCLSFFFFFSSRRRHTRLTCDWSSDVCSSDLVALMVKYVRVGSMELFLVGAIIGSAIVTAVFGWVCVRYTRIFFSILTLALSQVLWSLAFKFFWVTGGTDGLRVPTPS